MNICDVKKEVYLLISKKVVLVIVLTEFNNYISLKMKKGGIQAAFLRDS